MTTSSKHRDYQNYYSGGLSELVSTPTALTYSFLKNWFTGNGSLGKAMKLLGLPYQEVKESILELQENELVVNLINEERILYKKTIFTYKKQSDIHQTPKLVIDIAKSINPFNAVSTLKILLVQSKWIANPQKSVALAKKLLETILEEMGKEDIDTIDKLLKDKIWPAVIAIGVLSEFYSQYLAQESGDNNFQINTYISNKLAKNDWFFCSVVDQKEVQKGTLSFFDYIKKYGMRADKDYELASPRWYEIPETIKKRIKNYSEVNNNQKVSENINKNLKKLVDVSIQLQILRSEAKRKTLISIDCLRQKIMERAKGLTDIGSLTREEIINNKLPKSTRQSAISLSQGKNVSDTPLTGKGTAVSQGNAVGVGMNITNNILSIPKGTIGIFPNASPEFAMQYPKCTGMIFLKGGQTSHGAIVAREFGIPALIDNKAEGIKDGTTISLNGTTGEWYTTS